MGERVEAVSPVAGKNTVLVRAGEARFEIARAAATALGLQPGTALTPGLRRALEQAEHRRVAASALLRWLRPRPRTEAEVRRWFLRREEPPELAKELLGELRRQGLVDDARFARAFVETRQARRPAAYPALVEALCARGIPRPLAEAAAAPAAEDGGLEAARAAAGRRFAALRGLPPGRRAARLAAFLGRRGFEDETIQLVCRELLGQDVGLDGPGLDEGAC